MREGERHRETTGERERARHTEKQPERERVWILKIPLSKLYKEKPHHCHVIAQKQKRKKNSEKQTNTRCPNKKIVFL